MSRVLLVPNSIEDITKLKDKVDGFILPIKDLSINYNYYIDIKDIDKILKELNNKDIFISLNKNMHNSDLPKLKDTLLMLENYNIKGIMYYDISIVNYKKELNLKNDIVWNQDHLVTNYSTVNYWYNEGSKYAYLSSEITKNEIIEIKKNIKAKLIANIFGYVPIFTSKRNLVNNYLETFDKEKVSNIYYMYKEGIKYPLVEEGNGTVAYSGYVLNAIKEYFDLDLDYYVINSFLIEDIEKVVDIFNTLDKDNLEKCYQKLSKLIPNTSEGFLYQETIYKVKR
ncbi:MAG: U32 family peptidase [Bacilli bacterium]|nr:U32 family peptidase [Bacilli bacterium]